MSSGIWLLLFTGILLGIIVIFYFSPSYVPKLNAMASGPYALNTAVPTEVIVQKDAALFTKTDAGAFSAFVYLNPVNRTATYANSGSSSNGSNGDTLCTCVGPSDCGACKHAQYKTVFTISDIVYLEVLVAPDASRQGRAMAQIVVKTHGPTNSTYLETFVLPPLDIQKWTYITISREGRRIDIYYNNRIVLSTKTRYYFVKPAATANITSGSDGLDGQLLIANVYNYRLSTKDVSEKYAQYADTRGQPFFSSSNNPMSLSDVGGLVPLYGSTLFSSAVSYLPSFNLCPSEGCFNAPLIRPANPMYSWSSSYA